MIRNQKIIITANSAKVNQNHLTNVVATIPNMLANKSYLIATGNGNGKTQNFLDFLRDSPINQLIGNIPDKIKATGNGLVTVELKVPFYDPNKTTVGGKYEFQNNDIDFDMLIPEMKKVNGTLNFSNLGINTRNLTANILGGNILLDANTSNDGTLNFNATTHNIDYKQLSELYLPYVSPIFAGKTANNIEFSINSNGIKNIKATSDLKNIAIFAPYYSK